MSQIYVPFTAGSVPPTVATSYTTQSGSAVPSANVLIIDAFETLENNDNGIETKGGASSGNPPGTGFVNEVSIYLTNRITGQVTTTNSTPTTIITIPLGSTPATYYIYGNLQAFNASTPSGASYEVRGAFRTTGAAAIFIADQFDNIFEEVAIQNASSDFNAVGNSAILSVTGIVGLNINWNAVLEYRLVT